MPGGGRRMVEREVIAALKTLRAQPDKVRVVQLR